MSESTVAPLQVPAAGPVTRPVPWGRVAVLVAVVMAATAAILRSQGRRWWCPAGDWWPWSGDTWSIHNSQHLLDPYSFTHLLHGVAFAGLISLLLPRLARGWQLLVAVLLEAGWELIENSAVVIERYRTETVSLGYEGDSVINSLGDILCCATGFLLAKRLGLWWSLALFVAMELALILWIRDSLVINVIMLIRPIPAIKAWQMPG